MNGTARFGAESTAEEVLRGIDLSGRRVLVTGVSSGVGVETARVLLERGAQVVGAVRDVEKARAAMAASGCAGAADRLDIVELDLASLASVRDSARRLLAAGVPLDAVIANAGIMAVPEGRTAEGFEMQFGTNHLGHFVLVNEIAETFGPGSRVVMVSSAGHRSADVDLIDPGFERTPYDPLVAYRRSKTATVLFAVGFDRRHRERGVRATAVHPGAVLTETTRGMIAAQPEVAAAFDWKSVAQGAATSVWAGFIAPADAVGGLYCEDCHVAAVNDDPAAGFGVRSYALDAAHADELWSLSERMVGERF